MYLPRFLDNWIKNKTTIDKVSESVAGHIRAEQLASTTRLTPVMMIGNMVLLVGVLIIGFRQESMATILIWGAVLTIIMFSAMRSWYIHKDNSNSFASVNALNSIIRNSLILGTIWAILPFLMYSDDLQRNTIIAVSIAGMICGGGFALSSIPQAAVVFITPMLLSSTITLARSGSVLELLTIIVLWTYAVIVGLASLQHAKIFVERIVSKRDAEDQSQTIGLLLKDFEKNSSDWLWSTNQYGQFIDVSDRFSTAANMASSKLKKTTFLQLINSSSARNDPDFKILITQIKNNVSFRNIEMPVMIKGQRRWWALTGQPTYQTNGEFSGYNGVAADITERKSAEHRSEYLSQNDELSGLLNRRMFAETLNKRLNTRSVYTKNFAVFYLDLDQFKIVNDTRGHEMGDKLLARVANRMNNIVANQDVVSRLGGDEFAIMALSATSKQQARELSEKLLSEISKPYTINGERINIGVSIGIAMVPADGMDAERLLRNADLALYRSKTDGKRTYRFFKQDMDRVVQERRQMEFDLTNAIAKNEIVLFFQPLVCAEHQKINGFEALVRWNHPTQGIISPDKFIPVAERSGLIHEIGEWVLHKACQAASNWPEEMTISVNLSPVQFDGGNLLKSVKSALTESKINPSRLELEITESVLLNDQDHVLETLKSLKELGTTIAMDDFGTGYSSLGYLTMFPFDRIKIDRAFVSTLEKEETARAILQTISALGKSLNMKITAEGVENQKQMNFLRTISCDMLQGYYFAKPMAETDTAAYLLKSFSKSLPKEKISKAS